MKSSPKGSAERLTTAADYFTKVQRLLRWAKDEPNVAALKEGGEAIDSDAFKLLPNEAQEELLVLLSAAMLANGWGATG